MSNNLRRVCVIGVVSVMVVAMLMSVPTVVAKGPKPPPLPADPAIAAYQSGSLDIMVMNADGGAATVIYDASGPWLDLSWAPDGSAIVYRGSAGDVRRIDVTIVDGVPKGGNEMVLVASSKCGAGACYGAAWSPLGDEIAVTDGGTNNVRLFVVPATGGSQTTVYAAPPGHSLTYPAWDSSGRRIAVVDTDVVTPCFSIKIIDRATGNILATYPGPTLGGHVVQHLDWARNAEMLAFNGWQGDVEGIYVLDLVTGQATFLFPNAWGPSWSPDNTEIVCEVPRSKRGSDIVKKNVATGETTTLLEKASRPDWKR